jgi:hypothetical protein
MSAISKVMLYQKAQPHVSNFKGDALSESTNPCQQFPSLSVSSAKIFSTILIRQSGSAM